jgi:hypothetical protein
MDRATGKNQLAIDYEKWIFDIEQRGDRTLDVLATMAWVERLDERIYHRHREELEVKTCGPRTSDAENFQANVTRVITEVMEARLDKMGFNKTSTGDSIPLRRAHDTTPNCWGCNKTGHIRKNCPHKASNEGPGFAPKVNPTAGQQRSGTASAKGAVVAPAPRISTAITASAAPATAKEAVQELFSTNADCNTNTLLRFNGQVRWWDGKSSNRSYKTAYTLLDNGASAVFVSRRMANSLVSEGGGEIVNTGKSGCRNRCA